MSDAVAAVEPAADSYPARLDIDYPEEGLGRASTLFRIVLVIPVAVVAGLLSGSFVGSWQVDEMDWAGLIAGMALFGPTLLMLVFRQKYPRWWFDWNPRADAVHDPCVCLTVADARRVPLHR